MFYFKAPGVCIRQDFVTAEWGEFIRYVEVADDQRATRQVEVFNCGKVLRYERSHWCDDFGMLVALKFSRKPKWSKFFNGASEMSKTEFEQLWQAALRSKMWREQVERSRVPQWGDFNDR